MTENEASVHIGVLALQGDFAAHRKMLAALEGVESREVRCQADLEAVDGLILPGGESTTMIRLLDRMELTEAIKARAQGGMGLFGTCAGMILLARDIEDFPAQPTLGLLDITVARNAFGRQTESFESDVEVALPTGPERVHGLFIRAPVVTRAGAGVQVIASQSGCIVAVRTQSVLAAAFHPELTGEAALHRLFVAMVRNQRSGAAAP